MKVFSPTEDEIHSSVEDFGHCTLISLCKACGFLTGDYMTLVLDLHKLKSEKKGNMGDVSFSSDPGLLKESIRLLTYLTLGCLHEALCFDCFEIISTNLAWIKHGEKPCW